MVVDDGGLWDIKQTATYLGMSERWVQKQVAAGALPHRRLGRMVKFEPDRIRRWLANQPGAH